MEASAKVAAQGKEVEEAGRAAVSAVQGVVDAMKKELEILVAQTRQEVVDANARRAVAMKDFVHETRTRVWTIAQVAK